MSLGLHERPGVIERICGSVLFALAALSVRRDNVVTRDRSQTDDGPR